MSRSKKVFIVILGVLLLVVISLFIKNTNNSVIKPEVSLIGQLFSSMTLNGQPMRVWQADLTQSSPYFTPAIGSDDFHMMQYHTAESEAGTEGFVVLAQAGNTVLGSGFNISHKSPDGEVQNLLPLLNDLVGQRDLTFSQAANQLAFSAQTTAVAKESTNDDQPRSVSEWGVYLVDIDSKELTYVGLGRYPQWAPDGNSIVYLAADSVRQYDVATKSTRDVALPEITAVSFGDNMNLEIDTSGRQLIISSPNNHTLLMGSIVSWEPLLIAELTSYTLANNGVQHTFYWPTFSPDGQWLAVQMTDLKNGTEQTKPRVAIIDLSRMEVVKEISLTGFDFTQAYLDEWDY